MNKLPILITAIGGGGHGDQILKAIRLADRKRYFIVGADAQKDCLQSQWVDEFVTLPFANSDDYIPELLSVCNRFGVKALFHGCEPELKVFSEHRDKIEEQGILLPINPTELIRTCMNKEKTNQWLSELGFEPPRYMRAKTREQLREIDWFPVVVKPSVGGGGSANAFIAQNQVELLGLADFLGFELVADTFIIQEYVGTPDDEYTVGVLHDMDGNYINSIAVKRLLAGQLNIRTSVANRTERHDLGEKLVISSGISHGHIGRYQEVTEQCREIAQAIGARGAINIQCRFVDGKVKVFEINPRFSGTTSLRAMVGYNEPDILIRKHLFGENVEQNFAYRESLILRGLFEYEVER